MTKLLSKIIAVLLCFLMLASNIVFANEENSGIQGNLTDGHIFEDMPHLSNEKFFGEWDSENEVWIQEPLIDYDFSEYNQPILEAVRTCVKGKDYEGAKEKIFDYYKYLTRFYSSAFASGDSKENLNSCELVENNMVYDYMTMSLIDLAEVGSEWGYVTVDLTSYVSSVRSNGLTLDILALNKDGFAVEFFSRENSENVPYVEVIMNGGIKKNYYADADLYKSAGTNKTVNFGTENRLYCEESISSIGLTTSPVDENTKRTKIRFLFSDIKSSDVIESATLNLYGRNNGGLDSKKIVIFQNGNMTWKEDTYVWSNESLYYYSNDKEDHMNWDTFSDASYRLNEDRFRWIMEKACANAYASTENENYAYHALRTYMSFVYDKGDKPLYNKTLDAAVRLSQAPTTLRQLYDSEHMTPTIFTNHIKNMWLMCDAFSKRKASAGNWGTVEMAALYGAAFYFKEFKSDPAVGMSFAEYAVSQLEENVSAYVLEDGSTTELPIHYTCYALDGAMQPRGVVVSNGGQETYSKELKDIMRSMARYAVDMSAPGFEGNGHADDSYGSHHALYKNIGSWLGDQVLIHAGTYGQSGAVPDYTSVVYKEGSRQGVMRTGWGENDLYMHFNVDGGKGNHGHYDDLALIIFGYGDTLICDPLYISDANAIGDWLYSTEAHNTVTFNKGEQWIRQERGTIERWETNDSYDFVNMSTPNVKEAEASRKVLFVKPGFFIVTDYFVPNDMSAENHYDQLWHFNSDAELTFDESTKIVKSNRDGANLIVVPVDPDSIIHDNSVDYKTIDPVKAREYDTVMKRGYVKEAAGLTEAEYVAYGRKIKGAASFSTVLYPTAQSQKVSVSTTPVKLNLSSSDAQAFTLYIQDNNTNKANTATYYTLNNMMKKDSCEVGKYITDATLMYVENDYDNKFKELIAQDVTEIKNADGSYLLKTADGYSPEEISFMLDGQNVYISSSKELKLDKLTFYADKNTSKVYLNDKEVNFKLSGNYVYFGETPIVEGKEDEPETSEPESPKPVTPLLPIPGTHGSGTGGSSGSGGGSFGGGGGSSYIPPAAVVPGDKEINEYYKKELENHWAKNEIEELLKSEVVRGDGVSLHLNDEISRAEFTALIARAAALPQMAYKGVFADVSSNDWYADSLQSLYEKGIISGDGISFNPNSTITREEMAKILVGTAEYLNGEISENEEIKFDDISAASEWAVKYIGKSVALGLVKGDVNNCFNPKNNTLRAEAMITIYRLINFKEDVK